MASKRSVNVLWVITLVLALLGVLLQLIGLVTPSWVSVSGVGDHPDNFEGYDLQTGLWYRNKCTRIDCRKLSFGEEYLSKFGF